MSVQASQGQWTIPDLLVRHANANPAQASKKSLLALGVGWDETRQCFVKIDMDTAEQRQIKALQARLSAVQLALEEQRESFEKTVKEERAAFAQRLQACEDEIEERRAQAFAAEKKLEECEKRLDKFAQVFKSFASQMILSIDHL